MRRHLHSLGDKLRLRSRPTSWRTLV